MLLHLLLIFVSGFESNYEKVFYLDELKEVFVHVFHTISFKKIRNVFTLMWENYGLGREDERNSIWFAQKALSKTHEKLQYIIHTYTILFLFFKCTIFPYH